MTRERQRIALGRIAGAHGIKGDVLIETYTENATDIASYGPLGDEAGRRTFAITVRRVTPKGVIAHISGIDDRTAAEALQGVTLHTPRERLPEPEPDAYYHADLIGLAAVDAKGEDIGRIVGVHNYGAGDLLEIKAVGSGSTELIPFTATFVPKVAIEEGRVVVNVPPGETETPSSVKD